MSNKSVFNKIPIFGMIHLAGISPVKRALDEISLFEEEGLDGVIVENYHGPVERVIDTLEEMAKLNSKLLIGVNVLPNGYELAFSLAHQYNADFIQLDYVAGTYNNGRRLNLLDYREERKKHPTTLVLGGVWPKYYTPIPGSDLKKDLLEGMQRADAIVVTGAGTGKETPLEKIQQFRSVLGNHPLIVGAGLTVENVYPQLSIADGAIVGSYFKKDNLTENQVDRKKVKKFMSKVEEVRRYRSVL